MAQEKNTITDFSELVEYLDEKFGKVEKDMEDMREDFRNLQTSVDSCVAKVETYAQETTMLGNQVNRHERWIEKVAPKLDVKLES